MPVQNTEDPDLAWVASHRAVVALRTVEEVWKFGHGSKACEAAAVAIGQSVSGLHCLTRLCTWYVPLSAHKMVGRTGAKGID